MGSLVCTREVGRLTQFEWNLRLSSMMKQSTMCGLSSVGWEVLKKRGEENNLNFSPELTHREFCFTVTYKRNGGARDREYLRENSSRQALGMFRITLSFLPPKQSTLGIDRERKIGKIQTF